MLTFRRFVYRKEHGRLMARKRRPEEEEKDNSERWLLTYSDKITLLLAVFIVMYSMSVADAEKFKSVAGAMKTAFTGEAVVDTQPQDTPGQPGDENGNEAVVSFEQLYEQLLDNITQNGYDESISVTQEDNSIIIRFNEAVLFYPDQANFLPDGHNVLGNISGIIKNLEQCIGHIQIEGHTANTDPNNDYNADTTMFAWQLSCDRSLAVLQYFSDNKIIPQRKLSVVGFAHYKPVTTDNTEEGRAKNRRVELRITRAE